MPRETFIIFPIKNSSPEIFFNGFWILENIKMLLFLDRIKEKKKKRETNKQKSFLFFIAQKYSPFVLAFFFFREETIIFFVYLLCKSRRSSTYLYFEALQVVTLANSESFFKPACYMCICMYSTKVMYIIQMHTWHYGCMYIVECRYM